MPSASHVIEPLPQAETPLRIGFVAEGDASRSDVLFSGTALRMFHALQQRGHTVFPVDATMSKPARAAAALLSADRDRARWRSKFRYGNRAAAFRSRAAAASLGNQPADVLLQIGAAFDPPGNGSIPYAIYCDWNMALTLEEARSKGNARGLSIAELEPIAREHARRFAGAAAIFTISARLAQSFTDLYGIPAQRVHTAYAGANFDMSLIERALERPRPATPPTVLFIAKEFRRKGSDTVAAAMQRVQQQLPEAKLIFAGSAEMPSEFSSLANVEHLGLLDKTNPAQLDRLLDAYRRSDVCVLPSRHDPFPTVIREAMFFGIPCVGSNIWAMGEMIDDGRTGFLVAVDDSDALASRLLELLTNQPLRTNMGAAARQRAEAMFTWEAVGKVLSDGLTAAARK